MRRALAWGLLIRSVSDRNEQGNIMKNLIIKTAFFLLAMGFVNCSSSSTDIDPDLDVSYACVDVDGDGFTVVDEDNGTVECSTIDDCDDEDSGIYPGGIEYIGNGVDDDCDGSDTDDDDDDDSDDDDDDTDDDFDNDGVADDTDVCPYVSDADQANSDSDECGDACDDSDDNADVCSDSDADGVDADDDNCDAVANAEQYDTDQDGDGNECDTDDDGDGISDDDGSDNCPLTANSSQGDDDEDGIGNNCDDDSVSDGDADEDDDGIADDFDNCATIANIDQDDSDGDGYGDACDLDDDSDGLMSYEDNCPSVSNVDQSDVDGDDIGDLCDVETCSMDDEDVDEDGDGAIGCDDSDCTQYCEDYTDDDDDGLYNIVDPQDDVVNFWGYIDPDNSEGSDCVDEYSEFTYTYVEGTDAVCDEDDMFCFEEVDVDGAIVFDANMSTQACVGDSATSDFTYGIYIIQVDDDGDGLSNAMDPQPSTANSWWTINTDATTSKTFSTTYFSYTFVEGGYCDLEAEGDVFCGILQVFGEFSDSGLYVLGESSDGDPLPGVTDWSQSQGEVKNDSVGEYGVYVRQKAMTSVTSPTFSF